VTGDQALRELLDVSEDVVAAVFFDAEGEPLAASVGADEARSAAEIAVAMLAYADTLRTDAAAGGSRPSRRTAASSSSAKGTGRSSQRPGLTRSRDSSCTTYTPF